MDTSGAVDLSTLLPQLRNADVANAVHDRDDLDLAYNSHHHTIGTGPTQAAAGNHSHGSTVHTHVESDVTSLVTDLGNKAAKVHTHAESDVTSLVTHLAGKASTAHTHDPVTANTGASSISLNTTNLPVFSFDLAGGYKLYRLELMVFFSVSAVGTSIKVTLPARSGLQSEQHGYLWISPTFTATALVTSATGSARSGAGVPAKTFSLAAQAASSTLPLGGTLYLLTDSASITGWSIGFSVSTGTGSISSDSYAILTDLGFQ